VIRFSAFLVAVAVGLLVAGVVTSKLALVYVAIGVSGVALLALGAGALIKRNELFGKQAPAEPELARPAPAAGHVPAAQPEPQLAPWEAAVPAASAWPSAATATQPAPSRAGYLPAEQPVRPQPFAPQPFAPQAAEAPAAAWGSGFPSPAERPAESPADVPRRPAAFTPRTPSNPPSPAPEVPAPAPGGWEWRVDAPATQPFREVPRETPPPAPPQPPAQDELPAQDEPPDEQEPSPAADDPEEDQPTRVFSAVASTVTESAPEAAPSASDSPEPEPELATPEPEPEPEPEPQPEPEPAPAGLDLQREVTVVPGVPRYHNPHCLLIRFMGQDDLENMTLGAAREAGCTPCRACLPDQPETDTELGPPQPERQAQIALDVLPRGLSRGRTRPVVDREHLAGDQPRMLGQGRGHLRVIRRPAQPDPVGDL